LIEIGGFREADGQRQKVRFFQSVQDSVSTVPPNKPYDLSKGCAWFALRGASGAGTSVRPQFCQSRRKAWIANVKEVPDLDVGPTRNRISAYPIRRNKPVPDVGQQFVVPQHQGRRWR
jgi:hypothetical protein